MKKILLLAFFATNTLAAAFGQSAFDKNYPYFNADSLADAPNGSKKVIVTGVTFLEVCNAFLDAGLKIDKKDSELQVVSTTSISTDPFEPYIMARVINGVCTMSGTFPFAKNWNMDIMLVKNKKGKPRGTAQVTAFSKMVEVAAKTGKQVSYEL